MNLLENYPGIRKVLYVAQWLTNLVMGILGIVFLNDSHEGVPSQFTLAGLIAAFVWTYTGITASSNVPEDPEPQRGAIDVGTAIVIVFLGLVLLAIFGFFR